MVVEIDNMVVDISYDLKNIKKFIEKINKKKGREARAEILKWEKD